MSFRTISILFCFLPLLSYSQESPDSKATKIQFLQALNKLGTAFQHDEKQVDQQRDIVLDMMDKEVKKNNGLTEEMMKKPQRTPEQRKQLQDQLANTAKQKYLQKSFAELAWGTPKMDKEMALQVVRNFMEILQ